MYILIHIDIYICIGFFFLSKTYSRPFFGKSCQSELNSQESNLPKLTRIRNKYSQPDKNSRSNPDKIRLHDPM